MQYNTLLSVEKPARYMGNEFGSVIKGPVDVRFVLAFPDVYEVGMSHLGSQILYSILNGIGWAAAERAYAPWPDREEAMRAKGEPLATLESGMPLAEADIVGFTLQYELSYTNILNMLELAGIPLMAAERGREFPLVLGGGPCAGNPEPVAEFFDAVLFGDGEEAIVEIAETYREWKKGNGDKADLLDQLSNVEGVYIPSFFAVTHDGSRVSAIRPLKTGYEKVRRRIAPDLDRVPYPVNPVVPFLKTVHDRVSMEIARGCTRGCRFCQAGYIYRPVRERSPLAVLDTIHEVLRNTGYEEISLMSLSSADYGCIAGLLRALMERYADERVAVSFPSLRVGSLTRDLVEQVARVRKTGFTLAPEAGSERMRRVINKGILEEDLVKNAYDVYSAGWRVVKLYFMIGLPTETREDVLGIAELSARVRRAGREAGQHGDVNVSVSNFVPKPHTPFQWEPQLGREEVVERQHFLRYELKKRKLAFKWHDATLSMLEGVFARGDRRLSRVLLKARELGCRFDGWSEHADFGKWRQAFESTGMDPESYLRRRETNEILPWDHLDCGIDKDFLRTEMERALAELPTGDCRTGDCTGCGVCDFSRVRPVVHVPGADSPRLKDPDSASDGAFGQIPGGEGEPEVPAERIRLRFTKTGAMSLLSHLEMIHLFTRAVRRAGIPILYSRGFHPHPKFSFATALSVGVESRAEYMDMEIATGFGAQRTLQALNLALPAGIEIVEAEAVPLKSPSLSVILAATSYRVTFPPGLVSGLPSRAEAFLRLESFPYQRVKKGKVTDMDLRCELIRLNADDCMLEMTVGRGKPVEFASAITGLPQEALRSMEIEKLRVYFSDAVTAGDAKGCDKDC
ncbi:MAG: TIGR03960 family B12-binding radical SAM protein [Geobacteraceae bacterium]|nr:TIGR03960 family B12-binding radical SAM protein [Geobacteraceae bacterium]